MVEGIASSAPSGDAKDTSDDHAVPAKIARGAESPKKMEKSHIKIVIILIVGIAIIILGSTTGSYWPSIYDSIVTKEITLTETSMIYNMWKKTPIPMYLKLYMFNWTNIRDFNTSTNVKPHFEQMGPYVFREIDYKVNKTWNDNDTITFLRRKVWWFDESLSNGSLSDKVTNLNPIAVSVASSMKDIPEILRKIINSAMLSLGEKLFVTKSVGELLFEGYNDTLLRIAQKFKATKLPYAKFGWFYARNGSDDYDGTFSISTGASGLLNLGMLDKWNFSNRTDIYDGSCGIIKGSAGDLWPPLPNNETISVFIPDICTTLDFTYENTTIYQDVKGKKYIGDYTMLDNGTNVPSRQCYCPNGDCTPTGTLNISSCKFGAPVFVSMPHFYLADPSYRDDITGMKPNKEEHELRLVIEPNLGVPMQVRAQLQINLLLEPVEYMSIFQNVTKTYVPMLWFSQQANLTAEYASKVKLVLLLPSLGLVTFFGIASIGVLIFFIGIFVFIRQKWRGEEDQLLLCKNENDIATSN